MSNKRIIAIIAIITTVFLWGLSFISIKITVNVLPPMTLALSRFIIASGLLYIIFKAKESDVKLDKKDVPLMALAGFIGVTLYFYFENYGIMLTSASAASIIIATIPIFSLIAETLIFKSKLTFKKIAGVVVSFIGVYIIVGGNLGSLFSSSSGRGYLMMFVSVFAWVGYNLLTKPLFKKYSYLTITYYQSIFGTLFLIPFAIFERPIWSSVNGTIIFNVLYLGIFCSALAYFLYIFALNHLGMSTTTLYLNIIPLVTIIGSYFFLNEILSGNQVLGGILVILSVYLVNSQASEEKICTEEEFCDG